MTATHRTRLLVPAVVVLLLLALSGVVSANGRSWTTALPGENVFPEGIAYDTATNTFYVSSTTTGAIFHARLGDEVASLFVPGEGDARGLAVSGNLLFVAGGFTGNVWVYDIPSRALLATLPAPGAGFINDLAVASSGDVYVTDSFVPQLYRVYRGASGWEIEVFRSLAGTPVEYGPGFNLNGIAASANGRWLVVVQSNTGKLFRVTIATGEVREIDLGGARMTAGDGLELRGRTVWVVRNSLALVAKIQLDGTLTSGQLLSQTTDPTFRFPTTAAIAGNRLLVVNSQFNQRGGTPELPFTVSNVPLP